MERVEVVPLSQQEDEEQVKRVGEIGDDVGDEEATKCANGECGAPGLAERLRLVFYLRHFLVSAHRFALVVAAHGLTEEQQHQSAGNDDRRTNQQEGYSKPEMHDQEAAEGKREDEGGALQTSEYCEDTASGLGRVVVGEQREEGDV